jgi:hypothetical protein
MSAPTSIEAQAAHDRAKREGDEDARHVGMCWCCCWDCDWDYDEVRAADREAGSEEV